MNLNKEIVKPGEIWCHYKNKYYRIIAISCNTDDLNWYVVYEALYENTTSRIWHCKLDEFLELIEIDGKSIHRFTKKELREENNSNHLIHHDINAR